MAKRTQIHDRWWHTHHGRREKEPNRWAQEPMIANKIQAIVIDSGTALNYFTGIRWWPSERTAVAIIPAQGEIVCVCPAFEESRFRELISVGNQVVVWQEDESPLSKNRRCITNQKLYQWHHRHGRKIEILSTMVFAKQLLNSITSVLILSRWIAVAIKSAAELALMQKASDITVAAIKAGISQLKEGHVAGDLNNIISEAHTPWCSRWRRFDLICRIISLSTWVH